MRRPASKSMEAFIAGAFTLMFFKGLVWTLCFFVASIIGGKPEWIKLVVGIVLSAVGIALGVGILVGNSLARQLVRIYLSLGIIGSCVILGGPVLHLWSSQAEQANLNTASDLIVSIAILILLSWNKPPHVPEVQATSSENKQ